MTRTFAEDTSVPVARSRGEIDGLLRAWACEAIQWSDDYIHGRASLRFVWRHQGAAYVARLSIAFRPPRAFKDQHHAARCTVKHAESECWQSRNRLTDAAAQQAADQGVRAAHRVLLLWIKASLNAIHAGLASAEAVFLPFLEDRDGRTVSEIATPRLRELLAGSASRLLGDGT